MDALERLISKTGRLDVKDAYFIRKIIHEHAGKLLSLHAGSAAHIAPSIIAHHGDKEVVNHNPCHNLSKSCKPKHNKVMCKHYSRMSSVEFGSELNVASLDEFPSVSGRSARPVENQLKKPKRRIAPTALKSQPVALLSEAPHHLQESILCQAFVSPTVQPHLGTKDVDSKEDQHCISKKKQAQSCTQLNKQVLPVKMSENSSAASFLLEDCERKNTVSSSDCDQYSLLISSSDLQPSNTRLLDQLAELYSEIIIGFLVPCIITEMYFLVQLLTLRLSPSSMLNIARDTPAGLFKNISDCVYFSVSTMEKIKRFFVGLDKGTLRLLADNDRIAKFKPQLKEYFGLELDRNNHEQPILSRGSSVPVVGVQFQESTDNRRNFSDMKAFHAVKKQRDSFYAVLREWEKHCDSPKWTMEEQLGEKIQLVVRYGQVCGCSHFAKLFLKQLLESCYYSTQAMSNDLLQSKHFNKVDQSKLIRLAKRFYTPSCGQNMHQNSSFTPTEEFFADFIVIADSFNFNQHLIMEISSELTQLHHSFSLTQNSKEKFVDALQCSRILGKFLGFMEFLPFKKSVCVLSLHNRTLSLNLTQCLSDACVNGHLCLTVPWVVQYLTMMDSDAIRVEQYCSVLKQIIDIYRLLGASWTSSGQSGMDFFLLCVIGSLFEIPKFPSSLFVEHMMMNNSLSSHIIFGNRSDSLDCQAYALSDVLYASCPFLNELHSLLSEFAIGLQPKSGYRRKIKPLSTAIEQESSDPFNDLEVQLVENFFRAHPPFVKQICEITCDRLSNSAILHMEVCLIPKYVESVSFKCFRWLQSNFSYSEVEIYPKLEFKLQGETFLHSLLSDASRELNEEIKRYVTDYCRQCDAVLHNLFAGGVAFKVESVAYQITVKKSIGKSLKWSKANAGAKLRKEVFTVFEKTFDKVSTNCKENVLDRLGLSHRQELSSFKSLCNHYCNSTSRRIESDDEERLLAALNSLCSVIMDQVTILTSVSLPIQVFSAPLRLCLDSSLQLATHLVSCGAFKSSQFHHNGLMSGCNLLDKLVEVWKLCKGLKCETALCCLLSASSFQKYMRSDDDKKNEIWWSLAFILIVLIINDIISSTIVEGLWLCRLHQFRNRDDAIKVVDAVSIFLQLWHSLDTPHVSSPKLFNFVRLLNVVTKSRANIWTYSLSHPTLIL